MLILLLFSANCFASQRDSLLVVFWNVENFFDYHSDNKPDYWTAKRFYSKANDISKVMFKIASKYGRYPDIIAFAEIENKYVLNELFNKTLLRKLAYQIVHFDSCDKRGIDCAFCCIGNLSSSRAIHIYNSSGEIIQTRDIVLGEFDSGFCLLVNHHPSKLGETSTKSNNRSIAMSRMRYIVDSLQVAGRDKILCVGDFNDELWTGQGTLKYNGKWEKIDGYFAFGDIEVEEEVFDDPLLLEQDKNFGGLKPRRTYIGPRYNGGVSDHLPLVLLVKF